MIIKDHETEIANLKDSADLAKNDADRAAEQLRVERDALRARLGSLEEEYHHLQSCQTSDSEKNRRDADALLEARAEKGSLDNEISSLKEQVRRLEDEARNLEARARDVEKARSILQDQDRQELGARNQQLSTLLTEKDENIERLEADLRRSGGDLEAAQEKARNLQGQLDTHSTSIQQLQAESQRLRQEIERRDAANEELDDRRFDAEVALANDRRAFDIVQNDLVERSREAEARSRHKENLLTEALAQMAREGEEYRLTISTKPENDFLLLRVVNCEASRIRIRDRLLSVEGANELLKQLELANHDISQYAFLIGMERKVLPSATFSSVRKAWHFRQVLWVLPISSYHDDVRHFWVETSTWNAMGELERQGFALSREDGKLQYSNPQSPFKSAVRQISAEGNGSGGRKRKASPPQKFRARSRSRSPTRDARVREPKRERSPIRAGRETGPGRSQRPPPQSIGLPSTSSGSQNALDSHSSALQSTRDAEVSNDGAVAAVGQESMQTVGRIEEIMENE